MALRQGLKSIVGPDGDTPIDLIGRGAIADLSASPAGVAKVTLSRAADAWGGADALAPGIVAALQPIDGVERVVVVGALAAQPPKTHESPARNAGGHDNPLGLAARKRPAANTAGGPSDDRADMLPGVKRVIAVASGKGGVGKSTVCVNLAAAFARRGARVGLLDGDIHGPSVPTLLGLGGARPTMSDGKIRPLEAHGLSVLSIGNLVDADKALAWRGPMVMGALRQLLTDVDWGALDVLMIDTPPGTGDVHLSLGQTGRLSGAVIVSTPQELALADVRRSVAFFRQVKTPVLGLIENMAWLDGPDGTRLHLFGDGGARDAARDLDVAFLGALPIFPDLRIAGDAGRPAGPDTAPVAAAAFDAIAARLAQG